MGRLPTDGGTKRALGETPTDGGTKGTLGGTGEQGTTLCCAPLRAEVDAEEVFRDTVWFPALEVPSMTVKKNKQKNEAACISTTEFLTATHEEAQCTTSCARRSKKALHNFLRKAKQKSAAQLLTQGEANELFSLQFTKQTVSSSERERESHICVTTHRCHKRTEN